MNEIWKDIEGYEGLYQVSNFGRIKSLSRCIERYNSKWNNWSCYTMPERIMTLSINNANCWTVRLTKHKKATTYSVHRLVAKAFIPNSNNYPEVNHKDENRLNNMVSNLEWCDRDYNQNYGTRAQRQGDTLRNSGKQKRGNNAHASKVICGGIIYDCVIDCAEHNNVHRSTLSRYLNGVRPMPERWRALGLAYYIESEVA